MKAGIFTNLQKDEGLKVTCSLIEALKNRGVGYSFHSSMKGIVSGGFFGEEEDLKADIMIVIGGDGTILRISKYCARLGIPILGLNLGAVGFLAQDLPTDYDGLISRLLIGDYTVEKRSLLRAEYGGKTVTALNDLVLTREFDAKMLEIGVKINGEFVDRHHCDGFIVSTATGSTAYSLSAGGAILSPTAPAFLLTPLNSHSLHARPVVISDCDRLELKNYGKPPAHVILDGVSNGTIKPYESVTVSKADETAKFIRLSELNFYKKLLVKLNKWSYTHGEE